MGDKWTPWIPLKIPRANHACTEVKDKNGNVKKIFVAGGVGDMNANTALDTTEIYNPRDTSWKIGPSLPYPTTGAALVNIRRTSLARIVLIGGCQYDKSGERKTPCTTVYALDETFKTWMITGNLRKSRIDPVALAITKGRTL